MSFLARILRSVVLFTGISFIAGSSAVLYERYLYDYLGDSVVMLTYGRTGGTGFQVETPSGAQFTLTNAHICRINSSLVAKRQDGSTQLVHVIEIDKKHDLCIMTAVSGLRPLNVAKRLSLHERVWLIGHPGLRPLTLESGFFAGNMDIELASKCPLTEKRIERFEELMKKPIEDWTEKDIEDFQSILYGICLKQMSSQYINNIAYGGNSGSPVVDKWGNVVGVLFAGSRSQPTSSYTVPLTNIQDFLKNK